MSDSNTFLWLGVTLLVVGVFTFFVVQEHKAQIRTSLKKKGAKNIYIYWLLMDFDRSNHGYEVHYEDAEGKVHLRNCKVSIWGSSIYWKDEDG